MALTREKKEKLRRRIKIISTILKLFLLLIILVGIPLYLYFFQHEIIEQFSTMEDVKAFFDQYKTQSVFVYIGIQVVQMVICIIPGQWIQFAAGYMFGVGIGYLYSIIGAVLGSVITYHIARILGHDAMHLLFGEKKIKQMLETFNSKKAIILVFVIFLIPGIPKDLCTYVAGLSEMKLKPFLIISLVGRTPAMIGSLLIGQQVETGGYTFAIILSVVAVVLCVLGLLFRKHITNLLDRAYGKLMRL